MPEFIVRLKSSKDQSRVVADKYDWPSGQGEDDWPITFTDSKGNVVSQFNKQEVIEITLASNRPEEKS